MIGKLAEIDDSVGEIEVTRVLSFNCSSLFDEDDDYHVEAELDEGSGKLPVRGRVNNDSACDLSQISAQKDNSKGTGVVDSTRMQVTCLKNPPRKRNVNIM